MTEKLQSEFLSRISPQ